MRVGERIILWFTGEELAAGAAGQHWLRFFPAALFQCDCGESWGGQSDFVGCLLQYDSGARQHERVDGQSRTLLSRATTFLGKTLFLLSPAWHKPSKRPFTVNM